MFSQHWKYTDNGFARFGVNFNFSLNSSEVHFYTNNGGSCRSDHIEASHDTASISEPSHLTELIGMELNQGNVVKQCQKYKVWDTEVNSSQITTRLYVNALHFLHNFMYGSIYENSDSQIAEEKIELTETGYQITNDLSNGNQGIRLMTTVENQNGSSVIQIAILSLIGDTFSTKSGNAHTTQIFSLALEINENESEKLNAKLTEGQNKIFDAEFLSSNEVYTTLKYVFEEVIPSYLNRRAFARILF